MDWRDEALARFPELRAEIAAIETPMELWIELEFACEDAYEEPRNDSLIERIYSFADWSFDHRRDPRPEWDLPTAVCISFLESIVTTPSGRADLHRWWTLEDVLASKDLLSHLLDEAEWEELVASFGENPAP